MQVVSDMIVRFTLLPIHSKKRSALFGVIPSSIERRTNSSVSSTMTVLRSTVVSRPAARISRIAACLGVKISASNIVWVLSFKLKNACLSRLSILILNEENYTVSIFDLTTPFQFIIVSVMVRRLLLVSENTFSHP